MGRLGAEDPSTGPRRSSRPRILWIAAAVVAILAVVVLWAAPRLQPATGTIVVVAAGRSASSLPASTLMLIRGDWSWVTAGSFYGIVQLSPDQRLLLALPYTAVRSADLRIRGDDASTAA